MVRLFHFCPQHMVAAILREGLTRGHIPTGTFASLRLIPGYQWMTTNHEWKQEWCDRKYSRLPYDRAHTRLTIDVPDSHLACVLEWMKVGPNLASEMFAELNAFGDPQNYRLFLGNMPPEFITDKKVNPLYR